MHSFDDFLVFESVSQLMCVRVWSCVHSTTFNEHNGLIHLPDLPYDANCELHLGLQQPNLEARWLDSYEYLTATISSFVRC
jgi:hypothetical protein